MDMPDINGLIEKYKNNTASATEIQQLMEWYRTIAYQDAVFPESEEEAGSSMLYRLVAATKPLPRRRIRRELYAAASLLLIAGLFAGVYHYYGNTLSPAENAGIHQQDIIPGGNKAVLTLADGSKISLSDSDTGQVAGQSGVHISKTAKGQVIYTIAHETVQTTGSLIHALPINQYNRIETPKGGQYQVILPDGTKVWLNAVSSIRFPVSFAGRRERRIELRGQAYFEVAHQKSHPFRVVTSRQVVEVLGTHFDIDAYAEEPYTRTTLLEGSVKLSSGANKAVLKPGEQAKLADQFSVSAVNTADVTAWKNGYFRFDEERLEHIMQTLSRWYAIEVIYEDESLKQETFGVVSARFANISALLQLMEETGNVRFRIDGSTIRVYKRK